jgi:GGDEF domain-containing protein
MKSKHILSRLSNVSLLLVLLVLTGFSVWAASLNRQASIAVQESELYRQITYTLSAEESTQYEYVLRPSTALQNEHLSDANTLIALLQRLQQDGNPVDAILARQVSTEESRYLLLSGQFFAAVDAHTLALAQALHYQQIDPVFDRIQLQLLQRADEDQTAATSAMGRLSQAQQIAFTVMPIVFVLGLLLLIVSGVMTRNYRRKIDQAVLAEKTRSQQLTVTDPLTNLGNHSAYQQRLSQCLGEDRREGDRLVLALLDLDQFKVFNDQQGHQRGDEVLLAFAALLHKARLSDFLYRLGSDDFALIVPQQAALADTTLAL